MRSPAIAFACLASASLAGCGTLKTGAQDVVNFVDAPATQQAVATLKTVTTALVCDVSAGSALAKSIETVVGAHTGITGEIDVVSTQVCSSLQGKVVPGVIETDVNAVAVVATPKSIKLHAARLHAAALPSLPPGRVIIVSPKFVVVQQ